MAALPFGEGGKSGLHGGTVPGNARRGRPQGKCHRKYTAGPSRMTGRPARVKRCGKSAPRRRQRRRQGKPHREQDQVGAAGIPFAGMPGEPSRRRSGRSHEALGNERPRGMAIPAPRTSSSGRDRTRLTRRLALFLRTFQELISAAKRNSWFYLENPLTPIRYHDIPYLPMDGHCRWGETRQCLSGAPCRASTGERWGKKWTCSSPLS